MPKLASITASFLLAVCGALSWGGYASAQPQPPDGPVVRIEAGSVRGVTAGEVTSFRGIPYAAAPVGALRWRTPQAAPTWQGVRAADRFGPECMQSDLVRKSENCLTLNVWRPAGTADTPRPVMVWIHGGGLVHGQTSLYPADALARQGVVVVSMNYRMGRLGFFAHPALAEEAPDEVRGNYGFMDQRAALQWVQRNIAAFGGDPGAVTIFGQSAGGGSVLTHLTSPLSEGLFHRAILQSPGIPTARARVTPLTDLPEAEARAIDYARSVGVTGEGAAALKALRALPAGSFVAGAASPDVIGAIMKEETVPGIAGAIRDGRLVTQAPEQALAAARHQKVPVIIGANSRDLGAGSARTTDELFALFGPDAAEARGIYDPRGDQGFEELRQQILADRTMTEPARHLADTLARAGQPVWLYRFSYVAEALRSDPKWKGTPHGLEIPYIFDMPAAVVKDKATAADKAMAALASAYWVSFGKTGDPNGTSRPQWPRHEPGADTILDFGNGGAVAGPDPLKARLDLWQKVWARDAAPPPAAPTPEPPPVVAVTPPPAPAPAAEPPPVVAATPPAVPAPEPPAVVVIPPPDLPAPESLAVTASPPAPEPPPVVAVAPPVVPAPEPPAVVAVPPPPAPEPPAVIAAVPPPAPTPEPPPAVAVAPPAVPTPEPPAVAAAAPPPAPAPEPPPVVAVAPPAVPTSEPPAVAVVTPPPAPEPPAVIALAPPAPPAPEPPAVVAAPPPAPSTPEPPALIAIAPPAPPAAEPPPPAPAAPAAPEPVTIDNFIRAESDGYFAKAEFGRLRHVRQMAPIDTQDVVRMNRDTLYSSGVFDLDAAPLTITLPDAGRRFMSVQAISQDHYTVDVAYAPARLTLTRDKVGTRYVYIIVRTLAESENASDVVAANALQNEIRVEQAGMGRLELPLWDKPSQDRVRDLLTQMSTMRASGVGVGAAFGAKGEVEPISHLIGTAIGWGGNPPSAAIYRGVFPKENDGATVYRLRVSDVPVDGFWSISVYDPQGFFQKNELDRYSLNNLTARQELDGSYTVRFGGCGPDTANCLPIMPGWNYTVRLYRPRAQILSGSWQFPEAQPVR